MRLFLPLILLMLALNACKSPQFATNPRHPVYRIFETHEKTHLKKNQMKLAAAGVPYGETFDKVPMHYVVFKKMKVSEARRLMVSSIEDFLDIINNDEEIAEHLKKQPITYKDLKYNIGFGSDKKEFQEPPYIAYAYLDEGILHYCYRDSDFGHFIYEKDVKEPYETACQIIEQEDLNSESMESSKK